MKRRFAAALLAALTFGFATLGVSTTAAHAAQPDNLGHLVLVPQSGTDITGIHVTTTGPCSAKADAFFMKMYGKGLPKDGQVVTENTAAGLSRTAPFDAYFLQIMRDYATDNHTSLGGDYTLKLSCVDSFTLEEYGTFTGTFTFPTKKKYHATGASAKAPAAAANAAPTRAAPTATAVPAPSGAATTAPDGEPIPTITAPSGPTAQQQSAVAGAAEPNSGSSNSSVLLAIAVVAVIGLVSAWVLRTWSTRARR